MDDFVAFPKMARWSREVIVTEKIDGTNAQVFVGEDGTVRAGSRTRWITPEDDNHGFAAWVRDHAEELRGLGPGRHYGEWWGRGIQRGYGLNEKRFSLFNTERWGESRPACCHVVPVLWRGPFETFARLGADFELLVLLDDGSVAAPGFDRPEGIVIFHTAANFAFKKTFEKDGTGKGEPATPRQS